jgi:glycosyltransferase involved in cell wall biosynthesis
MTPIAVVIPTRNRGAQAAEAAGAVLRDKGDFELVVVDQSSDDATEEAFRAMQRDPRLRVIRSPLRGISNARNTGVAATSAPIIAFTDDDCRPEPGWTSAVLGVFQDEPDAALVFGRVRLPLHSHLGFGSSFEPRRRVLQGGVPLPRPLDSSFGIGANFAIRRQVLAQLGGFDPLLGAGAPFFRAGEEVDILIRALHAGYRVINATECEVMHLGVRTGPDVRPLHVGYQLSQGAAFGKHARLAGLSGLRDLGRWAAFYTSGAIRESIHLRRPRLGVPCYFVAGALLTFRYRIDRAHGVFRARG